MKICPFEKYFIDYISGELDRNEMLEFQSHLNSCSSCPNKLEEFYETHYTIKDVKRPEPSQELLQQYYFNLSTEFESKENKNNINLNVSEWYQTIFGQRSWGIKLAEVVSLILVGILIGRFLFNPQPEILSLPISNQDYFPRSISKAEVEYVNYYFQAAELLLLELKNIDRQSSLSREELEFNKNIAQKLLIKTFIIHEIALRQNDPKILRFLSKMELLLYEVSNIPTSELSKSIESLNVIIDDSNLLNDARKFQKDFVRFHASQEQNKLNPDK